jgi:NarL family two-component system response regulator LiaR
MTQEKSIRVLLVDDHAVVRSGLSAFMKAYDDLELVGEAANGERAVALCQKVQPDVVLMDLVMPGMDGATATKKIRDQWPQIQIIALSSFEEQELVHDALQAGAIGYLIKNISADKLANAIRSAFSGKPTLSEEAAVALIKATRAPAEKLGHDLTDRESEVLSLLVQGLNNSQIAEKLVISIATSKFHVSNILSKLSASSRTEAVSIALQNHLV